MTASTGRLSGRSEGLLFIMAGLTLAAMRYRLRTLLIALAMMPPMLAWYCWPALKTWLANKPLPPPPVAAPATNNGPYFVFYDPGIADPVLTKTIVTELLKGTPNTKIALDGKSGRLLVHASGTAHKTVQAIIGELQREATTVTTRKDGSVLTETGRYRTKK